MTQTSPPTSPSDAPRARPQLFSASSSRQPHADFENSILATIDGGQARLTRKAKRSRPSRLPMFLLSVAALGAGLYAVAQFTPSRVSMAWFQDIQPQAAPVTPAPPSAMPDTQVAQAEPVTETPAPGAAIEVLPTPPVTEAAVPLTVTDLATPDASKGGTTPPLLPSASESPSPATQVEPPAPATASTPAPAAIAALDSPPAPAVAPAPAPEVRATPPRSPVPSDAGKARPQARTSAPPPKSKTRVAKKPAVSEPGAESDAALLAAVLPHFHREPTSPAFEQRCGPLSGSAAASCRKRFCSGRQGADAACPDPDPSSNASTYSAE
jgi:hypothetical protein